MQTDQWSTEILLILLVAGVALIALGFLIAYFMQKGIAAKLEARLEQAQQDLLKAEQQRNEVQQELKSLNILLHEKEVTEGKLQTQLNSAAATEKRLDVELAERKKEFETLNTALQAIQREHHEAEKKLGTVQAESRSQHEQANEIRERLIQAESELKGARSLVASLNESLNQEGKKAKELEALNTDAREQLKEVKQSLLELQGRNNDIQERYQSLSNEHTELKTILQSRESHFKEQMQQLSETKQSLTQEFENLANKIFDEKGKTFTHSSQTSIDSMLKPFREQIEGFQKRINEVHDVSLQGNTSLNAEIKKVLDIGLQMSKEANNLTSALKGDSQQRGAWGEAQLRRTLEMSGMIEDAHYETQSSFKDADGKQKQTDYLIKLPDGKHIIIDSKVALNAYDRAVGAESPEEYQLAMSEHAKAVRKHIDDLSAKDYTNLVGMRSPSFVLMFMPIEPAYIEALKNNKDLFEYGYKKGIVLVSHTTLIPILRTVSNLWMIERSNAEAREISEKAGEIYNQVCVVAERLNKLGSTLGTVSNHYNSTVKAMAGNQGLYGKVDRFNQLSVKVSKNLPNLEPIHIDFENERLALIVEPIDDHSDPEPIAIENHPATQLSSGSAENQVKSDAQTALLI